MTINNDFNIEDIVYLKHDVSQLPRMVTAFVIDKYCVMYEVSSGTEVSKHFGYELSKQKTIY
jgi:hypothetical protein